MNINKYPIFKYEGTQFLWLVSMKLDKKVLIID